jgi:hypothetical protein
MHVEWMLLHDDVVKKLVVSSAVASYLNCFHRLSTINSSNCSLLDNLLTLGVGQLESVDSN